MGSSETVREASAVATECRCAGDETVRAVWRHAEAGSNALPASTAVEVVTSLPKVAKFLVG